MMIDINIAQLLLENKALLTFLLSLIFAALVILLRYFRGSNSKGNAILLVGPSDAGKTALLSTLVYGQTLPSHVSLQLNTSVLTLPSSGKSIKAVDIPGNPRVRGQIHDLLPSARVVLFVVDSSTISRNGDAVAEHLHLVFHEITSLPPSHPLPAVAILAHKTDLLRGSASVDSSTVALNRVKTVLERELEKRRQNQTGGTHIEGLGEEDADRSDWGGLESSNSKGNFQFGNWEGGEVTFIPTCSRTGQSSDDDEKLPGITGLRNWLEDNI